MVLLSCTGCVCLNFLFSLYHLFDYFFFFQAEDGIRDLIVTGVQTCALPISSSMYLPAILADPIARDLGVYANWVFGAFSAALVLSALLGPRIGRQIDLVGGRDRKSVV